MGVALRYKLLTLFQHSLLYLQSYLIFVIFFTQVKFLENKIYTKKLQFFELNL